MAEEVREGDGVVELRVGEVGRNLLTVAVENGQLDGSVQLEHLDDQMVDAGLGVVGDYRLGLEAAGGDPGDEHEGGLAVGDHVAVTDVAGGRMAAGGHEERARDEQCRELEGMLTMLEQCRILVRVCEPQVTVSPRAFGPDC
ncbi:hypothetical protein D3C87_1348540 [compost metagenome]